MNMTDKTLEQRLNEIDQKLNFITEQMAVQARRQREMQELKDDLNRIATDAFQSAVNELEEVAPSFDSSDLLYLIKKLLRNVTNITKIIGQLESVKDFATDIAPISKQAYLDVLSQMDELDRRGYFEFLRETLKIVDNVVTSFSIEDVKALSENIVLILSTVKNLTQPEMLIALDNAVSVYKKLDISVAQKVSFLDLFKEARTPEMRQGVAFGIQFLKNLATTERSNKFKEIINEKKEKQHAG
ncbi:MAG TPA: DUF1641 domain-containing protein [Bacteroidetes bacterium]|nr:DUF1641 domain-containing protein [Bacteroidota bacterium]HDZ12363.1 DUF1641 domain-containing protein [Bacteroidota bacterium]